MSLVIDNLPVPLRIDEHGVARVGGTRVTLDTVIQSFQEGAAPETIIRQYDTLKLPDVYAVLAYYLRHQAEVDEYLRTQEQEAEELRRQWEARYPPDGVKERLLARRTAQEAPGAAVPRG